MLIVKGADAKSYIKPIHYQPFDQQWIDYSRGFLTADQSNVMWHMLPGGNLGLATVRQVKAGKTWQRCLVTEQLIESLCISNKTSEICCLFPLWLYPGKSRPTSDKQIRREHSSAIFNSHRRTNYSPRFLAALSNALGLPQQDDSKLPADVSPGGVFGYIYAILHSPNYQEQYKYFLRIDSSHIPLPRSSALFRQLAALGKELVSYHLLSHPDLQSPAEVCFRGNPQVAKVGWTKDNGGCVWLDGKAKATVPSSSRGKTDFASCRKKCGTSISEVTKFAKSGSKTAPPPRKSNPAASYPPPSSTTVAWSARSSTHNLMAQIDNTINFHNSFPTAFSSPKERYKH